MRQHDQTMNRLEPNVRELGAGPSVICIHSNASSSGQWRSLMELLAPSYHVLAPDSYGSGKSAEWRSDRVISLKDEVDFLEPVFAAVCTPCVLVGHSYGAAVALIAALHRRAEIRALVLYEPTLFSLIDAATPPPNEADGIRNAVAAASRALDAGDRDAAAAAFIDYWMGQGSWEDMPPARKGPIAESVVNVRRWAHALLSEPTPLSALQQLTMPVLYMVGKHSTISALGVAKLLATSLPRVELIEFEELGHMGPITHPEVVNAAVRQFLAQTDSSVG
jgi:pimeloyl-ACP methyl ester carboxylesterase